MIWIAYIIIILILLTVLYFRNAFSRFDQLTIRIIEGEENIDNFLDVKSELLANVCNHINDINKNKVFSGISFLKKNDFDSFKLDRELSDLYASLKEYLMVNKSFIPDDETAANLLELESNEIELEGSKIFYNENGKAFNRMIDRFPTSIISRRRNYDYKYLYSFKKEEFFKIMTTNKKKNVLSN